MASLFRRVPRMGGESHRLAERKVGDMHSCYPVTKGETTPWAHFAAKEWYFGGVFAICEE